MPSRPGLTQLDLADVLQAGKSTELASERSGVSWTRTRSAETSSVDAGPSKDDFEGDFSSEELGLEQQIEQVLADLEVADATILALQMQVEIAQDKTEEAVRDIKKLTEAREEWRKAADEGQRQLQEREHRAEELLAAAVAMELEKKSVLEEEQRREGRKRLAAVAAAKVETLEHQVARLEEQVANYQAASSACRHERDTAEAQLEARRQEREWLRRELHQAKASAFAVEAEVREREAAAATAAAQRRRLERQALQLRGELGGLRARLASAGHEGVNNSITCVSATARVESLRLQHEVVALQAALRGLESEELELQESLAARGGLR